MSTRTAVSRLAVGFISILLVSGLAAPAHAEERPRSHETFVECVNQLISLYREHKDNVNSKTAAEATFKEIGFLTTKGKWKPKTAEKKLTECGVPVEAKTAIHLMEVKCCPGKKFANGRGAAFWEMVMQCMMSFFKQIVSDYPEGGAVA